MQLTKLTISGFKSFAKTTTFEFPVRASAIVGPNGSGKSNVAESIRWVLGEQSLKTLRGKKGEDLIFNGSPTVPRMGKASVRLSFDNRDHALPLDFDEAELERKIFRDGSNEYYLNGSQVRLKDIVELLAAVGLGETKHNIIGQGEVDRILLSSSEDRRAMLEEAIGLRLYQLKKRQAERKLEETGENIARVEGLMRELLPHLKFLKMQADKAEKVESLRLEFAEHILAYEKRERAHIEEAEKHIRSEVKPSETRLAALEEEIQTLADTAASPKLRGPDTSAEREVEELEDVDRRRQELERELGRIEGRLESRPKSAEATFRVESDMIERTLRPILERLQATARESSFAVIKTNLARLADELGAALARMTRRDSEVKADESDADLVESKRKLETTLKNLGERIKELQKIIAAHSVKRDQMQGEFSRRFKLLRELEDERNELKSKLQRSEFERERLKGRSEELDRLLHEANLPPELVKRSATGNVRDATPEELRKKIERLRARLEESGAIDQAVLKEHSETNDRYGFLGHELEDLKRAERDLRGLVEELENRIESDFRTGFANIKKEFQNYFKIIFGGGEGTLSYIPLKAANSNDEEDASDEDESKILYGVDIDVALPRKRIKGLQMLSGGERALVSIALLFAITAVNPPPFLVLDETDAALDEANSQKYAETLQELSKKTQLIIITHNRETMKQAGILYGVTMGEDGVSKVLSLKLEEAAGYGNR